MVDTVRTIATLLSSLFLDNSSGDISAQDMRDLIVSLMPPETTITYSGTPTWNLDTDPVAKITITGSPTVTISNGVAGRAYRLAVIQGGAGSFTVSFSGATVVGTPVWNTAVGAVNFVEVDFVGSTRYVVVV